MNKCVKTKMFIIRVLAVLFTLTVLILCAAENVLAGGTGNTASFCSASVFFGEDGKGFSGVSFSIYHIADISDNGEYILDSDFGQYDVNIDVEESSELRTLAQTLSAYAARDDISPVMTDSTGQDGRLTFDALGYGLYLISGELYTDESAVYTPEAMLVLLSPESGAEVEINCKFDKDVPGMTVSRTVQKVWNDGKSAVRPEEIYVQLLCDGAVEDTVKLSSENNWEYTWEGLDSSSRWQVAEKDVPDGYHVVSDQEGDIFILTNTLDSYEKDGTGKPSSILPYTGTMWLHIPILGCAGILLIVTGISLKRKQGDSGEK